MDLLANTFILASAVEAPFEGFFGLTSCLAKIVLMDQITLCARYILELPGLDITVLTKDISSRPFEGSGGLGTLASSTD